MQCIAVRAGHAGQGEYFAGQDQVAQGRHAQTGDCATQVGLVRALLELGDVPLVAAERRAGDLEAYVATLAAQADAAGFTVLVVSGDRDTIQLVNDDVTLLYPSVQGVSQLKRYDPDAVFEKYGVRPEQYPEIAALVAETSDNLPGIPKVGEKTAVKWINQFGSLEELNGLIERLRG